MSPDAALAALSLAAYREPATISGSLLYHGTHALIRDIPGDNPAVVVAFRGTDDPGDWLFDLMAAPMLTYSKATGPYFVHRGFDLAATSLAGPVLEAVGKRRVVLTGHSLGGAIALVLGASLKARGVTPAAIVTFGAPRVGFSGFASILDGVDVRQYRRGNDPVPTVPVALKLFPYCHARTPLITIGKPDDDNPFSCHHMAGYFEDINGV